MAVIKCIYCGMSVETERSTRKYCSKDCERKWRTGYPRTRSCRHCGSEFQVLGRRDANRQHCSKQCAKNHNAKRIKAWQEEHPETLSVYRRNYLSKNPEHNRERWRERRGRILDLLGGACVVCGASNPYWLHVDFIPTGRNAPYRHPRHFKYVSENLHLFRILCANHHYELTLTGAIEGTAITQ